MLIGIAFDLKSDELQPADRPDDWNEEFDSPTTIAHLRGALEALGHEVVELGNNRPMLEALLRQPPDLVFNIAEGHGISRNREARVPAVCEMLDIPCTGSDVLTLALALDKDFARKVVAEAGVQIPKGLLLPVPELPYSGDFAEFLPLLEEAELPLPVIAKPTCEGSSKGIRNRSLIKTPEELGPVVARLWQDYQQPVLLEEFIAGDEITVAITGNDPPQVLGVMRILPQTPTPEFVYSLEVKRNWQEMVKYEAPAKLPNSVMMAIEDEALLAYTALGCRDVARLDFRVRDGVPYFIEANPLPGLNAETGDIVLVAKGAHWSYQDLVAAIIDAAIARQNR
ncbi:MAG: D-alanine--D-alanine ligase [Zavarzinella sp.]